MAITQVGSTLQFGVSSTANTGNVSTAVTVPTGTDFVLAHVSAFNGTANTFSGGSMTFTKGAAQVAMTSFGGGSADSNTGFWQSAGFYLVAPDVGSSKTLAWDWAGTGTISDGTMNFALTFWQNVHQTTPVRNSNSATNSGTFPMTTPSLTAQSGDKIVAHLGGFVAAANGTGAVNSWTNATSLTEPTNFGYAELSLASADPTGNQTVSAATVTGYTEGGLLAIVLQPVAAAAIAAKRILIPQALKRAAFW